MTLATLPGPADSALQTILQPSIFDGGHVACSDISEPALWLDDTSWVLRQANWLAGSAALFEELRVTTDWRATERPMYDRVVEVPRLIATIDRREVNCSRALETVFCGISAALGEKFSSVGLNYYRTGSDSVAWHRDRIGRRGRPTVVALVSLGSPRTLAVRRYRESAPKTAQTSGTTAATVDSASHRWRLGHGDLLILGGACQHHWEHAVPKERHVGPRISLAFRAHSTHEGPRLP